MNGEMSGTPAAEPKEAYWQRTLQAWKDSGLRACEFQRQENLNKHAFIYWKLKLMGRSDKGQTFIAVKVGPKRPSVAASCGIRLRVGELFTLELTRGFDAQTLREVLAVVREQAR